MYAAWNSGNLPIYEPGLEDIVKEALERGNLAFSTDFAKHISEADIIFVRYLLLSLLFATAVSPVHFLGLSPAFTRLQQILLCKLGTTFHMCICTTSSLSGLCLLWVHTAAQRFRNADVLQYLFCQSIA